MKLGELFIELGTKGNTKELEKTLKQLKEAEKKTAAQIKLNKDLAKATTDEEKALIKKNYAQKQEITSTEKVINKSKERNKTILAGVKGFTRLIGAISLAIGVMDRFANASAKTNQSILTLSQTSGIDINTINKYASAARSLNYNVSREAVAQTFQSLSQKLFNMSIGEEEGIVKGLSLLQSFGGKGFNPIGKSPEQVLEDLRAGITNLTDFQAGQVLSQFGIGPELLPMLRMSSKEFAGVKNRFLSESQMREEQRRSLELQEKRDQIGRTFEQIIVDIYPLLNQIANSMVDLVPALASILSDLMPIFVEIAKLLQPVARWINKWFASHEAITPEANTEIKNINTSTDKARKEMRKAFGRNTFGATIVESAMNLAERVGENYILTNVEKNALKSQGNNIKKINVNNTFNNTINTTQPADSVMMDEYQRAIQRGHSNGNFIKLYE